MSEAPRPSEGGAGRCMPLRAGAGRRGPLHAAAAAVLCGCRPPQEQRRREICRIAEKNPPSSADRAKDPPSRSGASGPRVPPPRVPRNGRHAQHSTAQHSTAQHSATPHHVAQHHKTPRRCRISHRAGAILYELSAGEGDTEFAIISAKDLFDRQDRVQLVPR